MDHELAKQLKDAGVPQQGHGEKIPKPGPDGGDYSNGAYAPTLEELIEACGGRFKAAEQYPWAVQADGKWLAKPWVLDDQTNEPENKFWYFGSTPTEAVARLWLALHANGDASA